MEKERGHSGTNSILGAVLILIVVFLVLYFFTPLLGRGGGTPVNVPGTINVNPQ